MKNRLIILVAALTAALVVSGCDSHENSYDLQTGRTVSDGKVVDEGKEPTAEVVSSEASPGDMVPTVLSGSWGRVMIGAAQGSGKDNFFADSGYSCLHFRPDFTVEYEGVNFFKRYRATGTYELKPDENIVIWRLTSLTEPKDDSEENRRVRSELESHVLGSFYGTFGVENGRRTITSSILMFTEGVTWDWETGCYRDETGNVLVNENDPRSESSQMPLKYVGHKGDGWEIDDYSPQRRTVSVCIFEEPVATNRADATAWLKERGVTKNAGYELYFYSPAYIAGGIGP